MRSSRWLVPILALTLSLPVEGADSSRAPKSKASESSFGWIFEPSVGYALLGKYGGDPGGRVASGTTASLTGPVFGAQFGAVYNAWHATIRGQYGLLKTSSIADTMKDTSFGIVAGYCLANYPMRLFIGFNFIDSLDTGAGKLSSNSFSVGASYFLGGSLALNLEYHFRDIGKIVVADSQVAPTFSNLEVSLSLPLTFGIPSLQENARRASPPAATPLPGRPAKPGGSTKPSNDWNL